MKSKKPTFWNTAFSSSAYPNESVGHFRYYFEHALKENYEGTFQDVKWQLRQISFKYRLEV
jgi:hypothetical protein